ncbi:hypothetical protein U0070_015325 [Myodes glareolus]|uniref:Uncharacterized protein n=1 Tax=Myodes glareolus TaxID=447135 RepID=A0AAW0K0C1_MYOGA
MESMALPVLKLVQPTVERAADASDLLPPFPVLQLLYQQVVHQQVRLVHDLCHLTEGFLKPEAGKETHRTTPRLCVRMYVQTSNTEDGPETQSAQLSEDENRWISGPCITELSREREVGKEDSTRHRRVLAGPQEKRTLAVLWVVQTPGMCLVSREHGQSLSPSCKVPYCNFHQKFSGKTGHRIPSRTARSRKVSIQTDQDPKKPVHADETRPSAIVNGFSVSPCVSHIQRIQPDHMLVQSPSSWPYSSVLKMRRILFSQQDAPDAGQRQWVLKLNWPASFDDRWAAGSEKGCCKK